MTEEGKKERVQKSEQPEIMTKPLPAILGEIEHTLTLTAEAAKDARKAAEEARAAGEEALKASQIVPKQIIRKIVSSWDFLVILIVIFLASVIGAVAISLGLSLMRPLG